MTKHDFEKMQVAVHKIMVLFRESDQIIILSIYSKSILQPVVRFGMNITHFGAT